MFRKWTQSFSGKRNSFVRERKSCASERKVSQANAIVWERMQVNAKLFGIQYFCEGSFYKRTQVFCKWTQCFFGEHSTLWENAVILRENTRFWGKCNSFANERKWFVSECSFSGNIIHDTKTKPKISCCRRDNSFVWDELHWARWAVQTTTKEDEGQTGASESSQQPSLHL